MPAPAPDQFFHTLFASKAVQDGAVIRRKVRDVERLVGRDAFLTELKRRGTLLWKTPGSSSFSAMRSRSPVSCEPNSDAEFGPENDAFSE